MYLANLLTSYQTMNTEQDNTVKQKLVITVKSWKKAQ